MTAQISEKLLSEGEKYAMCTNPIGVLPEGSRPPEFNSRIAAVWLSSLQLTKSRPRVDQDHISYLQSE
jgi:hypothetical protein